MKKLFKKITASVLLAGMSLTTVGCASNAGNGALIGGATGAGIGAIIGNNSHHRTAAGALIGGAAGALIGGAIGNEMDKEQARRDGYYAPPPPPPAPPPAVRHDVTETRQNPDGSYTVTRYHYYSP